MQSVRKRRPGRTKARSGIIIITITIITAGITTTIIIIIAGGITTITTITTIIGNISVDDGAFENLGLTRTRRESTRVSLISARVGVGR
jgi:hypothetical protein